VKGGIPIRLMINVLTLRNQTFVSGSASVFIPRFQFKRSSQFINMTLEGETCRYFSRTLLVVHKLSIRDPSFDAVYSDYLRPF
jgi:hypothetical protein